MECETTIDDLKNHILILQMKLANCVRNLAACPEVYRPGFEALVRQTRGELEQLVNSGRSTAQIGIAGMGWVTATQLVG